MSNPLKDIIEAGQIEIRNIQFSRVTALLNLYHQLPGEDARQLQLNMMYMNESSEVPPYQRSIAIAPEDSWKSLSFDWIDPTEIDMIVLMNKTGLSYSVNPTEEQRKLDEQSTVYIAPHKLRLAPKRIAMFSPSVGDVIQVSCPVVKAKLEMFVVPK